MPEETPKCPIPKEGYLYHQHPRHQKLHKARFNHQCQLCGLKIAAGTNYIGTGSQSTQYLHPECARTDSNFTIPLSHLACKECGDEVLPCPECGRQNCHKEHIENFCKCGRCHRKATRFEALHDKK